MVQKYIMSFTDLNKEYINKIEKKVDSLQHKEVYYKLLDSLRENFDLFNKSSFSSIWYDVLISRFNILLADSNMSSDVRLKESLDLLIDIETKSIEVKKDPKNIFEKTDFKDHGIM